MANNEIMAQWANELESGNHKQTGGQLHDALTDGKCCLGVLCDMAFRAGVVERRTDNDMYWYGTGDDFSAGVLPDAVKDWAELDSHNPRLEVGAASYLNDGLGFSFGEIAQKIRIEFGV